MTEPATKAERRENIEALPSISWRRWVTGEFRSLRKWIKVHNKLDYRALRVRIKEMDRRLEQLNGAHEKEKENRASFVLVGTYNSDLTGTRAFQQRSDERFTKLELAQSSNPTAGLQQRLERAEERIGKIENQNAGNAGQEGRISEISNRVDTTTRFMWILMGAYFFLIFAMMVFGIIWGVMRGR